MGGVYTDAMREPDHNCSSSEDRLTELEIRISHQEAALDDVGAILIRQQKVIDELTRTVDVLNKRLSRALAGADGGFDPDQGPL